MVEPMVLHDAPDPAEGPGWRRCLALLLRVGTDPSTERAREYRRLRSLGMVRAR